MKPLIIVMILSVSPFAFRGLMNRLIPIFGLLCAFGLNASASYIPVDYDYQSPLISSSLFVNKQQFKTSVYDAKTFHAVSFVDTVVGYDAHSYVWELDPTNTQVTQTISVLNLANSVESFTFDLKPVVNTIEKQHPDCALGCNFDSDTLHSRTQESST